MEDQSILDKINHPDTRDYGYNVLVRTYQQRIYWLVRKMVIDHDDANDLTQDIFIKIWKNINRFKGDSELFTWIYRIATNETLGFLRKKKRRFFLPIHDLKEELTSKLDASVLIEGDEIQLKLQKSLLKLPEKQRLVFNMKYFEEMKFEEIAKITGTSTGALKASYHIAVKKIEEWLKED